MHRLTPPIPTLLAGTLVVLVLVLVLVLAGQGGARSAESVTCSSTTFPRDAAGRIINLTGTWTANGQPYTLRQIGGCLWWTGLQTRSNVFFGTVFGSTVTGVWTDVRSRASGTSGRLTLSLSSQNRVLLRRSSTGALPARIWRKTTR
jgi:hypothetical protein